MWAIAQTAASPAHCASRVATAFSSTSSSLPRWPPRISDVPRAKRETARLHSDGGTKILIDREDEASSVVDKLLHANKFELRTREMTTKPHLVTTEEGGENEDVSDAAKTMPEREVERGRYHDREINHRLLVWIEIHIGGDISPLQLSISNYLLLSDRSWKSAVNG